MELISTLFYFLIVIGVLIIIHEFGHFIAARISGMRTETFCIGMGHRLLGWNKKLGFTFGPLPKEEVPVGDGSGDTELRQIELGEYCDYRLAMFPIGGYVKISGMVDESMDTGYTKSEPQLWEFRSKNPILKTFVLSAGVLMNFLLAWAIFSGITFFRGETIFGTTEIGYVISGSVAEQEGFKAGDKIISIDGEKVEDWHTLAQTLTLDKLGGTKEVVVRRNDGIRNITVDGEKIVRSLVDKESGGHLVFGLVPSHLRTIFGAIQTTEPAGRAGLKAGDTVLSVNSEPINSLYEFIDIMQANKETEVFMTWKRGDEAMSKYITPNSSGKIGVGIDDVYVGPSKKRNYSIFESLGKGWTQMADAAGLFVSTIAQLFKGTITVKESLGGPIAIAISSSEQAERGLANYLSFMALLSISLGIINIFPFPALDGGHIVFVIIEGIIRREVSVKVKMRFQQAGLVLLFLLIAFIFYNDITRYF